MLKYSPPNHDVMNQIHSQTSTSSSSNGKVDRSTAVYGVVALYAVLVSLYGATTAVFRPSRLSRPLFPAIGAPRIDSGATVALIVSGLFVVLRDVRRSRDNARSFRNNVSGALLRMFTWYGPFGWLYIAANSVVHSLTLHKQLTHFLSVPTESQFGLACFILSVLAWLSLSLAGWPLRNIGTLGRREES